MSEQVGYKPNFIVGKTYLTQEGKRVKIIAENRQRGYECVQGDDGVTQVYEDPFIPGVYEITDASELGWRYDRGSDVGRCTGTAHDFSCPQNLVVGSEQND